MFAKRPLLKLWLIRASLGLGGLLVVSGILLALASGPMGRWAVMNFADGRELPGGLTLELEGLSGNVLSNPALEQIVLSDANGPFLTVSNTRLSWNGLAAIGGSFRINALRSDEIILDRLPETTSSQSPSGTSLPNIQIGNLDLPTIQLGEAVLGEALTLSANGATRFGQSGYLGLDIQRTDVAGDRLSVILDWSGESRVSGRADAFISGAGPIGRRLPIHNRDVTLRGQVSGTQQDGSGELTLQIGGNDLATGIISWEDNSWSIVSDVTGRSLLEEIDLPIEPVAAMELSGEFGPFSVATLMATGEGWTIEALPVQTGVFDVRIHTQTEVWSRIFSERVEIDQMEWSGQLDTNVGIVADGLLSAVGVAQDNVRISQLGGRTFFTYRDGESLLETDLTLTDISLLSGLPTQQLDWASLSFEARHQNREIMIETFELGSDLLSASGQFDVSLSTGMIAGDVNVDISDVAHLTDRATGPLQIETRIEQISAHRAVLDAQLTTEASDIRLNANTTLPFSGTLQLQFDTDYSAWSFTRIEIDSPQILLTATASGIGAEWQAEAEGGVAGDLPLEAITMDGAAAFSIIGEGIGNDAIIQVALSTPSLTVSGHTLSSPRLGMDTRYESGALTLEWQADAGTPLGDFQAQGRAGNSPDFWLTIESGQIGRYAFAGDVRLPESGLEARLDGQDWRFGTRRLDTVRFNLEETEQGFDLRLDVGGDANGAIEASLNAEWASGVLTGQLSGVWNEERFSTPSPFRIDMTSTRPNATASLRLGRSELGIRWGSNEQLIAAVSELDLALLSAALGRPAIAGTLEGQIDLSQAQGIWTGRAVLNARDVGQGRLGPDHRFNFVANMALADTVIIDATIDSAALSGNAHLSHPGRIRDLSELIHTAQFTGEASLAGEIAPLLAFMTTPDETLRGSLSAALTLDGPLSALGYSGEVELAGGEYRSNVLGVRISDIAGVARLRADHIQIQSLTATDGKSGTASLTGALELEDGWHIDLAAEFNRFQALSRPDLSLTMTGTAQLGGDRQEVVINGEAQIDTLRARPPEASAPSFAEISVTEINRSEDLNPAPSRRLPIRLNYHVSADDNLFMTGEAFTTEWRSDLLITGLLSAPNITGSAELVNGRAFLLNRAFSLEEGQVALNGGPQTARINMLARHSRNGLTVDARLSGAATAPELTLTSDPSLPEDEILAQLLFDRGSGQLSALETAAIAAQLSGQNVFGLVNGLREAAGLDRLDISTDEDQALRITGGRQITDDVYLELETTRTALSSARLEWTLTPDLTLLSRLTGDTDASIALRWRTEY